MPGFFLIKDMLKIETLADSGGLVLFVSLRMDSKFILLQAICSLLTQSATELI